MSTASQLTPVPPPLPPSPQPGPALEWRSAYPPEAWRRIRAEGIYLGCVLLLAVVVATLLLLMREKLANHTITQELLCCGLGGITGSWIYAMKWYVRVISNKIWRQDLIVWRLTSPFMGIFMAVSGYVIIKAGLLGVSIGSGTDTRFYAYGIGFLMGLFTDVLMGKLTEVAQTLFGKAASEDSRKSKP